MNKIILMGRLTADPELKQTQSGIQTCRFTVAVNRRFKDKSSGETKADFISCQAWRQTAEFICKYFSKGNMICLEGSLQTGSYTDKKYPDVTHYTTDILVDNVEFTGSKSESNGTAPYTQHTTAPTAPADFENVDLSNFEELGADDTPF